MDTMNLQESYKVSINNLGELGPEACQDREVLAREPNSPPTLTRQNGYMEIFKNCENCGAKRFSRECTNCFDDFPDRVRHKWRMDETYMHIKAGKTDGYEDEKAPSDDEIQTLLEMIKRKKGLKKYFITFTLSPENAKKKNIKRILELEVQKVAKSKMFDVKFVDWNMEEHKSGAPHVHMYMECDKYVKKQSVLKLYKLGNINFQKVKDPKACLAYCLKEVEDEDTIVIDL